MTLRRTIHRRAARKRAKKRPAEIWLVTPQWAIAETVQILSANLRIMSLINRQYDQDFKA